MSRLIFLVLVVLAMPAWGQALPPILRQIRILQVGEAPKIDGRPDEAAWALADSGTGFTQQYPADTSKALARTVFKLMADEKTLYVAAWCYRPATRKHFVLSLRRDFTLKSNDNFSLMLCTVPDGTNGFNFSVSPVGSQREAQIINGTNSVIIWDQVWYAEAAPFAGGWSCEMAIPLRSIRYQAGQTEWKINATRTEVSLNEISNWYPIPRNLDLSDLAFTGEALWQKPPTGRQGRLALIPYVAATASQVAQPEGTKQDFGVKLRAGGDAKIAVSRSLNLDVTANPDFSNVEVDRQQLNLTRFELAFPEQRQFFTENTDLFNQFGFTRIRPFFSRRVGLAYDRSTRQYVQTPIPLGLRLSGKLDRNWRIGVLSVQTGRQSAAGTPGQNYSVLAVQRQIFGRSNIAAILVNRDLLFGTQAERDSLRGDLYDRVVGVDYNLSSRNGKWAGKIFYHQNFYKGQGPDAATNASYLQYKSRTWNWAWNHEYVGTHYRAQVGFVPRKSYYRLEPSLSYRFYPRWARRWLNFSEVGAYMDLYTNHDLRLADRQISISQEALLTNTANVNLYVNDYYNWLFFGSFDPTGKGLSDALPAGSSYRYRNLYFEFESDRRKQVIYSCSTSVGQYYAGHLANFIVSAGYRPIPYGTLSMDVIRSQVWQPYGQSNFWLLAPRAELSFSRKLFVTGVLQYNGQSQTVGTNLRVQYRFAPVSDMFLVYSENYLTQDMGNRGDLNYLRQGLLNRGIIFKLVYWFNV